MIGIEGNSLGVWGKFYPHFIIRRFYQIVELKRQNKTDTKHFFKWKHQSEKYISEGLGLEILGHQLQDLDHEGIAPSKMNSVDE